MLQNPGYEDNAYITSRKSRVPAVPFFLIIYFLGLLFDLQLRLLLLQQPQKLFAKMSVSGPCRGMQPTLQLPFMAAAVQETKALAALVPELFNRLFAVEEKMESLLTGSLMTGSTMDSTLKKGRWGVFFFFFILNLFCPFYPIL